MSYQGKKIVATIECRMTSSRLPGKVLLQSCGKSMLEHMVERLSRVEKIDEIIFATTVNSEDDGIVDLANRLNIQYYRGSENDVLKRVLEAVQKRKGDIIVETTGDCPLIDPDFVSQTLDLYLYNHCDYTYNNFYEEDGQRDYPEGMDVEVFSEQLLCLADQEGKTLQDREHVSWFFIRQPERFNLLRMPASPGLNSKQFRLTLDEIDDYHLINAVFEGLYPFKKDFSCSDMIEYLNKNPEVFNLNRHVHRI